MPYTPQKIQVNGRDVQYFEVGKDSFKPVILLHGGMADAAFHWQALLPHLAPDYHIIAPDLPGFGGSAPLAPLTYASLLAWVQGLYAALQIEQAVLVGHAFGALVARLYAAEKPLEVPALILINGGLLPGKPTGFSKLLAQTPLVSDMLFKQLSQHGGYKRETLDWLLPDVNAITDEMLHALKHNSDALAQLMKAQVLDTLPEKRQPLVPTFLIWGADDPIEPLANAERIVKALPGAELAKIEGARHLPHLQEPEVVAFQIHRFLQNMGKTSEMPGVGLLG